LSLASESKHQIALVKWFHLTYPHDVIFSIPNGGYRTPQEAARLKAEGVLAGVCDIFIPGMRLFIEMKTERGVVSKSQRSFMNKMRDYGFSCTVAHSFLEARTYVCKVAASQSTDSFRQDDLLH